MDQILGMSPLVAGFVVFAGGTIAAVAVTLFWGVSQWRVKSPYRVGDQMKNARVVVSEWSGKEGYVHVDGELWRAFADEELAPGDKVIVAQIDGLILKVTKTQSQSTI